MDVFYAIDAFLKALPPHAAPEAQGAAENAVVKAGIIPFIRRPATSIYVMRPRGVHPELGSPPFQLAKGTRMTQVMCEWVDMEKGDIADACAEPLPATALREGIEELGLVLDNIKEWWDMGTHTFASASTGKPKWLRLFAAEMHEPENFLPMEQVAPTTAERRWMRVEEFMRDGRADQRGMVAALEKLAD